MLSNSNQPVTQTHAGRLPEQWAKSSTAFCKVHPDSHLHTSWPFMFCLFVSVITYRFTADHLRDSQTKRRHASTHTIYNQLADSRDPVKRGHDWCLNRQRNKWNQSKLIRNGSSIQRRLGKHKEYVRGLTRMQLHPLITIAYCIQSVSLLVSLQCANVYLEQRMMNNDFHGK